MKDRYKTNIETSFPDRYQILKENARGNRNNPTEAEAYLWNFLKGSALGVKFRRQHAIGDYIADFICLPKKVIIEVDGGYHFTAEQEENDAIRTDNIEALGFRIIRFKNEDVLFNIDNVINIIKREITN